MNHLSRACLHLCLTALLFLSAPFASAQRGAYTAPANLSHIVQQAQTIVRGHVVSVKVEPHPQFENFETVVVTLRVTRLLKGDGGRTITFRQYIWDPRDVATAAEYRKTQELLLFLNPVSEFGLTSPVGLEQGRFRVVRDKKGNASVENGRGNAGLFDQLASDASARGITLSKPASEMARKRSGTVGLDAFENTVVSLAGARP